MKKNKKNKRQAFIGHDYYNKGGRKYKYRRIIRESFRRSGYKPVFADFPTVDPTIKAVGSYFNQIKKMIRKSSFCIFDLTCLSHKSKINMNVLLELGVAIGANRLAYIFYKGKIKQVHSRVSDLQGNYGFSYKNHRELKKNTREILQSLKAYSKKKKYFEFGFRADVSRINDSKTD